MDQLLNLNKKTLLLVDDEPSNLHVLKQILQDDYQLLFAKDAKRALVISHDQQPDLILLDIMLPDMTGYEVCQLLKQSPRTARIPIIIISAMSDYTDIAQGILLGAAEFITKPVSPANVREQVALVLSRRTTIRDPEVR